jgi:hypothetical protein
MTISWVYDDGGREKAGFAGIAQDCACRAISIATGEPYIIVYEKLTEAIAITPRRYSIARHRTFHDNSLETGGIDSYLWEKYLQSLNWKYTERTCILTNLPLGRLVIEMSGHAVAVVDRVFHDIWNSAIDPRARIYGYWTKREIDNAVE